MSERSDHAEVNPDIPDTAAGGAAPDIGDAGEPAAADEPSTAEPATAEDSDAAEPVSVAASDEPGPPPEEPAAAAEQPAKVEIQAASAEEPAEPEPVEAPDGSAEQEPGGVESQEHEHEHEHEQAVAAATASEAVETEPGGTDEPAESAAAAAGAPGEAPEPAATAEEAAEPVEVEPAPQGVAVEAAATEQEAAEEPGTVQARVDAEDQAPAEPEDGAEPASAEARIEPEPEAEPADAHAAEQAGASAAATAATATAESEPAPTEPPAPAAAATAVPTQPAPSADAESEPATRAEVVIPVAAAATDAEPAPDPGAPGAETAPAVQPAPDPGAPAATAAAEPPPPPPEDPPEVAALRQAREDKTPVEGKVIGWNRGGFHVALDNGVTAFCPNSEMEINRPKEPAVYIDRSFQFQVLKVQKRGRRVVLSRTPLLAEQRDRLVADLAARAEAGDSVRGRVSSLTDFGAFVDLGGIEGLIHVSEISRKRVGHPKHALEVGQEVEVRVLKIEQNGERISLSMKALEPDPWEGLGKRYQRGDEFTGKVVRKADFGVFVELEPEVDGLIHLSRLPPGMTLEDPALEPGQEVKGWVFELDARRQRISLSLREIPSQDPWAGVAERYPEGREVEGTVESTTPFGAFITLEPGLTGLLPTSEMQVPRGTNPARLFSPGQKVKVQVVTVDSRRKRISLAREGAQIEGSRSDYQRYLKDQQKDRAGMNALAAAFAKIREEGRK